MKTFGKSLITLVKNENGGVIHLNDDPVNLTRTDPSKQEGFIKLLQRSSKRSDTGYINEMNRYFTYFGKVQALQNFIEERIDDNDKLPGRIIIKELRENEVPESFKKLFYNHKDEVPEKYFVKKAGEKGPVLWNSGQRIMRFPIWFEHPTDNSIDEFLPYDNKDEVKQWRIDNPQANAEEGVTE